MENRTLFQDMNRSDIKRLMKEMTKGGVPKFKEVMLGLLQEAEDQAYQRCLMHGALQMKTVFNDAIKSTLKEVFKFGPTRMDRFFNSFDKSMDNIQIAINKQQTNIKIEDRKLTAAEKNNYIILRCFQVYLNKLLLTEDNQLEFFSDPKIHVKLTNLFLGLQELEQYSDSLINDEHLNHIEKLLETKNLCIVDSDENKIKTSDNYVHIELDLWRDHLEELFSKNCSNCSYEDCSKCTLRQNMIKLNIPVVTANPPNKVCEYSLAFMYETHTKKKANLKKREAKLKKRKKALTNEEN